jgi:protein phosphatase
MKLKHYSKSVVGSVRVANEDCIDSVIINSNAYSNVFVVCDGMGGHVGGAKASEIATKNIIEYFSREPDSVPQNALRAAIEFTNIQIYGTAQVNPELNGMGTTCTVLVENGGLIYIAHVGDSRIYICSDNKLYRLTKDHSYVQGLVDAGEITDAQMETHPRKNELTRALGISEEVKVEVASQPIFAKKGDKFLLCTDGLCGLISDKLIASTLNSGIEIDATVHELISLAEKAGGHDNISVDLVEIIQSEHSNTKFENKNNENYSSLKTQELNSTPKNKNSAKNKALLVVLLLVVFLGLSAGIFKTFYHKENNTNKKTNTPPDTKVNNGVDVNITIDGKKNETPTTPTKEDEGSKFPTPTPAPTRTRTPVSTQPPTSTLTDKEKVEKVIKKINTSGRISKDVGLGCTIEYDPKDKMKFTDKDKKYMVKVKVSLNDEVKETSFEETVKAKPKPTSTNGTAGEAAVKQSSSEGQAEKKDTVR